VKVALFSLNPLFAPRVNPSEPKAVIPVLTVSSAEFSLG
jgi:hypothetical protein